MTGKNYLQWYGYQAQLVVTEPELIKEILNNRERAFPKADNEGYVKKILGDGLVTTEGEKWGKLRKLANYAFHGESLKVCCFALLKSILLFYFDTVCRKKRVNEMCLLLEST